jgi:undecaprenyl pyrophosphate phosphatase UppP
VSTGTVLIVLSAFLASAVEMVAGSAGMRYLRAFGRFWWNFIVGDDWRVAAGVAVALGVTALLVQVGVNAWWLLPAAVALVLAGSLRRAVGGSVR